MILILIYPSKYQGNHCEYASSHPRCSQKNNGPRASVRTFSTDYNPPHKDAYLPYYEDVLNIWIPICGCNKNSSLPLMPKSHLMNESSLLKSDCKSAKINNMTYNVPCILKVKGDFKLIRPNPPLGKAIIFSPYLIHGAASNNNEDTTRIALELRLSRK